MGTGQRAWAVKVEEEEDDDYDYDDDDEETSENELHQVSCANRIQQSPKNKTKKLET
jgi:hypothetical protein